MEQKIDNNSDALQLLGLIDERIDKAMNQYSKEYLKKRIAVVDEYDEETLITYVKLPTDENENTYMFYNKSGSNLQQGDYVSIQYTTNFALGDLLAKTGEPRVKNVKDNTIETAKRLQTNSTDCYVETSGTSVYHYDNAYSSNNRYMYESLADGYYQKYAYDGSNDIFRKSIVGDSCYIDLYHNDKAAHLSVNIDNGGFQYHGDNCEIIFDGSELYCRNSGYTFLLSPSDLLIRVGGVEVVDYNSGRLYLRAADGIYANGTQIG